MINEKITAAFILAAGFGTRLKPFTDTLPKALVPYKGTPMIENVISVLKKYGVTYFYINTHHFADKMEKYFTYRTASEKITLIYEENILGTGGALKNAEKFLDKHENFYVYNTDVDCDADLNELGSFHLQTKSIASLCVQNRKTSRYLLCDEQNRLIGRTEDGIDKIYASENQNITFSKKAFCGIHVVSSKIFKYLKAESESFDIIPQYMKLLNINKEIRVFDISHNNWKDLGIPENL